MSLDIEVTHQVVDYLRNRGVVDDSARITILEGGVSNRTVLVECDSKTDQRIVIKQALSKLRVDVDWYSDPARVHREASGLRCLESLLPSNHLPSFLFEDFEHQLYAMTAVPLPHVNWKTELLAGNLKLAHIKQAALILATLHQRSSEQHNFLSHAFDDCTFFDSLRLEPYYMYAASVVIETEAFLSTLVKDTKLSRHSIVHGDFSPKNILVHDDRLYLLDYEVIHWGDPAFDLGFMLTHLLSKSHHLDQHRNRFKEAALAFWHTYESALAESSLKEGLYERVIRHTLGCLIARVAGRSPLEYLTDRQRAEQERLVIELIAEVPQSVESLIDIFVERLSDGADYQAT